MIRRRTVLYAGTLVGALVILILLVQYGPERVLLPILGTDVSVVALATALVATNRLLSAAAPVALLGPPYRGRLGWWARTRVFLGMQPLGLVAPGRVTDFGALPLLKEHYPPGALASSIVLDRLVTLFFLLLLAPLAIRVALPMSASAFLDLVVLGGVLVVGSIPFLLSNTTVRRLANRHLLRLWPGLLRGFGSHTEILLGASAGRLVVDFALTALKAVLWALALCLLAWDVGVPLSLTTAVAMSIIIQLATLAPISMYGIGIAEASIVLLFSLNGFSEALALSISIVMRALLLIVLAILYFLVTLPVFADRLETAG